jgi:hypothetical protein
MILQYSPSGLLAVEKNEERRVYYTVVNQFYPGRLFSLYPFYPNTERLTCTGFFQGELLCLVHRTYARV